MNTNKQPEATLQDIINLVDQMCNDTLLFTKYDITKKLRHMGYHVLHKDVKRAVEHDIGICRNYDYSTTRTTVAGSDVTLYHPISADISVYDPNTISQFKVNRGTQNDPTASTNITNYSFDRYGHRYTVKAEIARKAGFPAGTTVYLKIESGKIILNKQDGRKIMSDCHSNIRIRKSDFEKAFSPMPTKIKIEVSNDKIEIVDE
jgi:hypothetical protein